MITKASCSIDKNLILGSKGRFEITNSFFLDNIASLLLITESYAIISKVFSFENFKINNVFAFQLNDFGPNKHSILISNSYFSSSENGLFEIKGVMNLTIIDSFFSQSLEYNNSISTAFHLKNLVFIIIRNCNFFNFNSSAITISNDFLNTAYTKIVINSSVFLKNKGSKGGAVFGYGSIKIELVECTFSENMAIIDCFGLNCNGGIGSAIYFVGSKSIYSDLLINSSIFLRNYAGYFGSVFSDIPINTDSNNSMIQNFDAFDLNNKFFSFPLKTSLEVGFSKNKTIEIYSGQPFALQVFLFDNFNQKLVFDSQNTFSILNKNASLKNVLIQSSVEVAKSGDIFFPEIIIKSETNGEIYIFLEGEFVDFEENSHKISESYLVKFLPCPIGSIILYDFTCYKCPDGTYSFSKPSILKKNYIKCLQCPINCLCLNGTQIIPFIGYYKHRNISENVVQCSNCLDVGCLQGSYGILCNLCEVGYEKNEGYGKCVKCDFVFILIKFFFIIFFAVSYICFVFMEAVRINKKKGQNNVKSYFKIATNHFQQISIVMKTFHFENALFKNILDSIDFISLSNHDAIANDCFYQYLGVFERIQLYAVKVLTVVLFPFFLTIILYIIWQITIQKSLKINKSNLISAKFTLILCIAIFVLYSSIIRSNLVILNCVVLDNQLDKKFWIYDPRIECWNQIHLIYVLTFAFTSFIIWGIGFPYFLSWTVKKNIKSLDEEKKSLFLFFHKEYKEDFYYWESIIFFKKYLISALSSFDDQQLDEAIFLLIAIILFSYFLFVWRLHPFRARIINNLEVFSIFILLFSKFYSFFSLVERKTDWLIFSLTICFVLLNINFSLYIFMKIIQDYLIKKKIKSLSKTKLMQAKSDLEESMNSKSKFSQKLKKLKY